ncbi:hypothetical protein CEXT_587961, partial [Caerostris extrusa]
MNGSSLNTWLRRPDDPGTNGPNVRERGREKRRWEHPGRCNSGKNRRILPRLRTPPSHSLVYLRR